MVLVSSPIFSWVENDQGVDEATMVASYIAIETS